MSAQLIEVERLSKRFGGFVALDDINLVATAGERVGLIGPNGSGKSTLVNCLCGTLINESGTVRFEGQDLAGQSAHQRTRLGIARSFQLPRPFASMTVADNVAYGLTLRKLPREEVVRKVSGILATTKLSDLAARYPGELSGGQQQRVALARALIVDPETLLLDEPLSNLDANLREEMRFEVRRLHDEYRYTTVYGSSSLARPRTSTRGRAPNSSPASSAPATS